MRICAPLKSDKQNFVIYLKFSGCENFRSHFFYFGPIEHYIRQNEAKTLKPSTAKNQEVL